MADVILTNKMDKTSAEKLLAMLLAQKAGFEAMKAKQLADLDARILALQQAIAKA